MKNLKTKLIGGGSAVLLVAFCALAQSGSEKNSFPTTSTDQPDAGNLRTFFELARLDIKTQKAMIIAENLPMTEAEAAEFWPLHHEYEAKLSKLNDQKYSLIARYDQTYLSMTDKEAAELAKGSFDLEEKKTDLKRKYFKKFQKAIPARKAARFFQIENQLNMVLDLRVAASLPLIK
jgi:hypothetical protein